MLPARSKGIDDAHGIPDYRSPYLFSLGTPMSALSDGVAVSHSTYRLWFDQPQHEEVGDSPTTLKARLLHTDTGIGGWLPQTFHQ
jgi:hypothetical protein